MEVIPQIRAVMDTAETFAKARRAWRRSDYEDVTLQHRYYAAMRDVHMALDKLIWYYERGSDAK